MLHELMGEFGEERRNLVPISQIPPVMINAVLAIEDARFFEHNGVDYRGMVRAGLANLGQARSQGASTITMQLAGLLDADYAMPKGGQQSRSITTKIGQASTAWRLERRWRKEQAGKDVEPGNQVRSALAEKLRQKKVKHNPCPLPCR